MAEPGLLLEGKNVLVTGGAGLIGTAFCNAIAAAGGSVVVADIDAERATEVANAILSRGQKAFAVPIDICDRNSILEAISLCESNSYHLNGLVNNAYPRNQNYGRELEAVEYDSFCENLSLHLGGYFLSSQIIAKHFAENGGGAIINMASVYGVIAPRFDVYAGTEMTMPVEYAAIKAGILHLTRYFAQYYKKQGVRVLSISPGGVEDRQPENFLTAYRTHCGNVGILSSDHLTGALVFALSDQAAAITGQNFIIDDGFTL